jgi:hypothetical protein
LKLYIDWLATICGILGSFLVATPFEQIRFIGFLLFLTGNILWILYSRKNPALKPILVLNAFYFLSSSLGIFSNLSWLLKLFS